MNRLASRPGIRIPAHDFRCKQCHYLVSVDPLVAGVKHRNHCPYCLWSKHVDMYKPGDRLSACKAAMQPVGLSLKRIRKKYGSDGMGELMLIHRCSDCGKLSINRIAADDDPDTILEIFLGSWEASVELSEVSGVSGICLLSPDEENAVRSRLFGWNDQVLSC